MKNQTVQLIDAPLMKELGATALQAIPAKMTRERAEFLKDNKGLMTKKIQQALLDIEEGLVQEWKWRKIYHEFMGISFAASSSLSQPSDSDFNYLIVEIIGIRLILDACKKAGLYVQPSTDVEQVYGEEWWDKIRSDYRLDKSANLWIKKFPGADGELRLSADKLKKKGGVYMSLEQRLLFGLRYYVEEKEHLDTTTITLCAGSRFEDGFVPEVMCLVNSIIKIDRVKPDAASPNTGARPIIYHTYNS